MKHTPQLKIRTGLRAGDNNMEDCNKGFQEFVEKCNLYNNPELLANLQNLLGQYGYTLNLQQNGGFNNPFAEAGQSLGQQWMNFGQSFIP